MGDTGTGPSCPSLGSELGLDLQGLSRNSPAGPCSGLELLGHCLEIRLGAGELKGLQSQDFRKKSLSSLKSWGFKKNLCDWNQTILGRV